MNFISSPIKKVAQLFDLSVDKVSLVTKWETPAVPQASNAYMIEKTAKKEDDSTYIKKLQDIAKQLEDLNKQD